MVDIATVDELESCRVVIELLNRLDSVDAVVVVGGVVVGGGGDVSLVFEFELSTVLVVAVVVGIVVARGGVGTSDGNNDDVNDVAVPPDVAVVVPADELSWLVLVVTVDDLVAGVDVAPFGVGVGRDADVDDSVIDDVESTVDDDVDVGTLLDVDTATTHVCGSQVQLAGLSLTGQSCEGTSSRTAPNFLALIPSNLCLISFAIDCLRFARCVRETDGWKLDLQDCCSPNVAQWSNELRNRAGKLIVVQEQRVQQYQSLPDPCRNCAIQLVAAQAPAAKNRSSAAHRIVRKTEHTSRSAPSIAQSSRGSCWSIGCCSSS